MEMKPYQPPAFNTPKYDRTSGHMNGHEEGMTLRDYFAAKAMQGLMMSNIPVSHNDYEDVARLAYKQADEMLKERIKQS